MSDQENIYDIKKELEEIDLPNYNVKLKQVKKRENLPLEVLTDKTTSKVNPKDESWDDCTIWDMELSPNDTNDNSESFSLYVFEFPEQLSVVVPVLPDKAIFSKVCRKVTSIGDKYKIKSAVVMM